MAEELTKSGRIYIGGSSSKVSISDARQHNVSLPAEFTFTRLRMTHERFAIANLKVESADTSAFTIAAAEGTHVDHNVMRA